MSAGAFEAGARSAIRERLLTVTGLPAVAWEGRSFSPAVGQPWLRERLLPISETPAANGTVSHRYSWELALFYPAGSGLSALTTMRSRIIDHFAPGLKLAYEGVSLTVMESSRKPPVTEPDWLQGPLSIVLQGWSSF